MLELARYHMPLKMANYGVYGGVMVPGEEGIGAAQTMEDITPPNQTPKSAA